MSVVIFSAAWLLCCLNTVNTSFKLNWGMILNKPCVSMTYTTTIASMQTNHYPHAYCLWVFLLSVPTCFVLLVHSWNHSDSFVFTPQNCQIPTEFLFSSATHWSVTLRSHTNSSTCFPSHIPSPSTGSFDLISFFYSSILLYSLHLGFSHLLIIISITKLVVFLFLFFFFGHYTFKNISLANYVFLSIVKSNFSFLNC